MADHRERPLRRQLIGQRQHIAHQVLDGVGRHALRLARAPISALIGRHRMPAAGERRHHLGPAVRHARESHAGTAAAARRHRPRSARRGRCHWPGWSCAAWVASSGRPVRAAPAQPAQSAGICRGMPRLRPEHDFAPLCAGAIGARAASRTRLRGAQSEVDFSHAEDQGRRHGRRDGRRRDDTHHLEAHQGQADPPLPRRQPRVLRPRRRVSRHDQRPGHHRRRQRHQEVRRGRQVRHHHPRRGPRQRVRPQGDVALAQRHHPQHPGRRDLPRAHHLQERAAPGARLDAAHHHRPPRLRRPVPRHRLQVPRQGHHHASSSSATTAR